jgi:hypothetical protein
MPLDDHTLILQLERSYEALEDEVKAVADVDQFADIDHSHDELAYDADVDRLEDDLAKLEEKVSKQAERLDFLDGFVHVLQARIAALEAR